MNGACPCGTSIEESNTYSCYDCGTACCRSCSIELAATTYCCWCAPSLARTAVN